MLTGAIALAAFLEPFATLPLDGFLDAVVALFALDVILCAALFPVDFTLCAEVLACFAIFPVPVVVPAFPVVVPVPAPVLGRPAAPHPASRRAVTRRVEAGASRRRTCKRFTSTPSLS